MSNYLYKLEEDPGSRYGVWKDLTGKEKEVKGRKLLSPEKNPKSENSEWPELLRASFVGDAGKVESLLSSPDTDVNVCDTEGNTSLILASRKGNTEVCEKLLASGAHVDAKESSKDQSALMLASTNGHNKVVPLLLRHKAQINMQDSFGCSALILACGTGQYETVKILLESGADANIRDQNGDTALTVTCTSNSITTLDLLLDHGAHINAQNNSGLTALMMAFPEPSMVKLLLERGADPNIEDTDGDTALLLASSASKESTKVMKLLLDAGAQVNKTDTTSQRSALMCACCRRNNVEAIQLLIEHNAKIHLQDSNGSTALMYAARQTLDSNCENYQAIEFLLRNGADVNLQDKNGNSPLLFASAAGNITLVEVFLSNGAEINLQDSKGRSALYDACGHNNTDVVRLLLDRNAQVDLPTAEGFTPLMIATRKKSTETVFILLQREANVNLQTHQGFTCLMTAATIGYMEVIDIFLAYNTIVDLQDKDGKSALMHAVCSQQTDFVTQLLELGAQIDLQDNNGWSSLMHAVKAEDLEVIQILVAYGASVQLRNFSGSTIFNICPQDMVFLPLFQNLYRKFITEADINNSDSNYPGIAFSTKAISSDSGMTFGELDNDGISVYIPENSLFSTEKKINMSIRSCFSGPFELPDEYESASPAYLIHHDKMDLQKGVTIRMHHYASLQSEEDCEDMAFLSASSTPEYRGSRPVYTFKEIQGAKGVFRPGDQVGEISLRHFCIVKSGRRKSKRKRDQTASCAKKPKANQCLYSARLYRNIQHQGDVSAVFCMCLFSPIYTRHCDRVIMNDYRGMSDKGEGRSQVFAEILGEVVNVQPIQNSSLAILFDKKPTQILKRDIHIPEVMDVNIISEFTDYPPRLLIYVRQTECSSSIAQPEVQVTGLDRECSFEIAVEATQPLNLRKQEDKVSTLESAVHKCMASPQLQTHSTVSYQKEYKKKVDETMPATDVNLDLDDLGDILESVESLSSQWKLLATKLRIKPSSLDIIQQNHPGDVKMCLYEALGEWLRLNFDHQRHGRPSWWKLGEAVKSLDYKLFEEIKKSRSTKS